MIWRAIQLLAVKGLSIGRLLALAIILDPEDWGLVAIAAVTVELACSKLVNQDQAAECLFDSVFVLPEPGPSAGGCAALASLLLLSYRRRRAARG